MLAVFSISLGRMEYKEVEVLAILQALCIIFLVHSHSFVIVESDSLNTVLWVLHPPQGALEIPFLLQ